MSSFCRNTATRDTRELARSAFVPALSAMTLFPLSSLPVEPRAPAWAALLERFYARTGLPVPPLERLTGDEVPPPYKGLLVHSADMTGTLERFYGKTVGLEVLSRELQKDSYLREVILHVDEEKRPVEYGVIQIYLRHFPASARRRVLEEQAPLGGILNSEGIGYLSWPQAFFCLESDAHIDTVLRLAQPNALYGRRNVLLDGSRRLLAEVMEILAPVEAPQGVPSAEINGKQIALRGHRSTTDLSPNEISHSQPH